MLKARRSFARVGQEGDAARHTLEQMIGNRLFSRPQMPGRVPFRPRQGLSSQRLSPVEADPRGACRSVRRAAPTMWRKPGFESYSHTILQRDVQPGPGPDRRAGRRSGPEGSEPQAWINTGLMPAAWAGPHVAELLNAPKLSRRRAIPQELTLKRYLTSCWRDS